jgi:hypothetical protein
MTMAGSNGSGHIRQSRFHGALAEARTGSLPPVRHRA